MTTRDNDATRRIARRITAARQSRGWELHTLAMQSGIGRWRLERYEAT